MKKLKLIALASLAILAVVVVLQNTDPVETRILFWSAVMSRSMLLGLTFAGGMIAGVALGLRMARRRDG